MKNISAYDKALVTMAGSAGSAEREMETASEAISFHLNKLKETWVGVAQDIFQKDTVNAFVDALTSVSNILVGLLKPIELVSSGIGFLSKGLGGLGTIATIAVAALSAKNIGRDKMFSLIKYADNYMCSVKYDSFHIIVYEIHRRKRSLNMLGIRYNDTTLRLWRHNAIRNNVSLRWSAGIVLTREKPSQ